MGILVGMGWIILGILYIIYKFGEEELRLGTAGGIGCISAVIIAFLLLGGLMSLSVAITGDDTAATIILLVIFISTIVAIVLYGNKISKKEKRKIEQMNKDWHEMSEIEKSLPMPTASQMRAFVYDARNSFPQSVFQKELIDRINRIEAEERYRNVDADDFKKFQAAWLYYSQQEAFSPELRLKFFGEQDIGRKCYFNPSMSKDNEMTEHKEADHDHKGF